MDPRVGLCSVCAHGRVVGSARGSRFWLCERSRSEPAYVRYPALPVRQCGGHEPEPGEADPSRSRGL